MLAFVPGPARAIPVVGVASASQSRVRGKRPLARYNLYRIAPDPSAAIEMAEYGLVEPAGHVAEIARHRLVPSRAQAP